MAAIPAARELDLSDPADVLAYLVDTPFASTRAEPLAGGSANFVFRLHLAEPRAGVETLVLKHAKPWIAVDKAFPFSVERQEFEAKALEHVRALLPADAFATVPALHHHDSAVHVLIMEDCGPRARTLKKILRDADTAPLSADAAQQIGGALGRLLAAVHVHGSADAALLAYVTANNESKRISAWATYGRLVDTLIGSGESAGLVDPPLLGEGGLSEADLAEVGVLADATAQAVRDARAIFTMGDFWTGNVLVRMDEDGGVERVYVVDWEMTKPGLPFLDYAQFVAEMHTLRLFHDGVAESVEHALRAYAKAYREDARVNDEFLKGAAAHMGAHLVTWTPRAGWKPKKMVRDVVREGAEYLLRSKRADMDWMKTSAIGELFAEPDRR